MESGVCSKQQPTATSKNRIQHLLGEILELRYNEKALQERNLFVEGELRKEKERSNQLLQEVQDLNTLNIKSKEYCMSEIERLKGKGEEDANSLRNTLQQEMKQRLGEKDVLIREIRTNNQQSEDFLRKRIDSYETQYKMLEENYSQLKQLFDEYQVKSQAEKSRLLNKIKGLEQETKRPRTTRKQEGRGERYDSLKHEYSNLLEKSAKSQRRMTNINTQIQDLTRQYSKKLLNKKLGYRLDDDCSNHKSVGKDIETDKFKSISRYESFNNFQSLQHSKLRNEQSTKRSPLRSFPNTINKQNNSFFSNVNLITNFEEEQSHPVIQVEVLRPSMPSSDKIQTNKKKCLEHLVLGHERESLKPNMGSLEVETPCFESRYQKSQAPRVRKINLKSRK